MGTRPRDAAPESSGGGERAGGQREGVGGRGVCGRSHSAEPAGKEGSGEGRRRRRRRGVLGVEGRGKGAQRRRRGEGTVRAHGERGLSCGIDVTSLGFPQRREHG